MKWARREITFPFWVRSEYRMKSSERVGRFDLTVESVEIQSGFLKCHGNGQQWMEIAKKGRI